ncbi:MAG: aspartyl protease [Symploca sp. SIO3C6]|uniref:Aspartyl protease n=1 Tax=Symploca sp. SIO1C4 TaxID=2607765 RepID=A0A6B3NIS7_9CYAN|nr:aspartyl protease [Symploca sp. SIO3C6]NER29551.1 aspartyl protease [Symploca sp. SIO1C4]NET06850.1 aspartyl protease [Symploca sp. SIO2B6]
MTDDYGQVIDLGNLCGGNSSGVLQTKIVRRDANIPVVEVTFNGTRTFEMLLDTGASGTAITPQMAKALGVLPEGTVLVDTAAGRIRVFRGRVNSIATGGIVANNLFVTIHPSLPIGLLGQDLFGNYDVTIRKDVVEFAPRQQ